MLRKTIRFPDGGQADQRVGQFDLKIVKYISKQNEFILFV